MSLLIGRSSFEMIRQLAIFFFRNRDHRGIGDWMIGARIFFFVGCSILAQNDPPFELNSRSRVAGPLSVNPVAMSLPPSVADFRKKLPGPLPPSTCTM